MADPLLHRYCGSICARAVTARPPPHRMFALLGDIHGWVRGWRHPRTDEMAKSVLESPCRGPLPCAATPVCCLTTALMPRVTAWWSSGPLWWWMRASQTNTSFAVSAFQHWWSPPRWGQVVYPPPTNMHNHPTWLPYRSISLYRVLRRCRVNSNTTLISLFGRCLPQLRRGRSSDAAIRHGASRTEVVERCRIARTMGLLVSKLWSLWGHERKRQQALSTMLRLLTPWCRIPPTI